MVRDTSLDLHALNTPPAFILSQDQTLKKRVLIHSSMNTEKIGFTKYYNRIDSDKIYRKIQWMCSYHICIVNVLSS